MTGAHPRRAALAELLDRINLSGYPVSRLVLARMIYDRANDHGTTSPTSDAELAAAVPPALDYPYSARTVARARPDLEAVGIEAIRTPAGHVYVVAGLDARRSVS
jgi:hypothetical protein